MIDRKHLALDTSDFSQIFRNTFKDLTENEKVESYFSKLMNKLSALPLCMSCIT